jgi:D-lactate dehydrogenase
VDAACVNTLADLGVKLIALRCAGFNNVDLKAAKARNLSVVRVPAYSPHAVAEHALALLLTLSRRTHRAYNRVRELNFSLNGLVGANVQGKTVGVIGTGKIGRIAAQIFRGFDATVLACDPAPQSDWAARHGIRYAPLPELLAASDIVTLHSPLLPETKHLINEHSLAQMKRGVLLLNTSRGKLIETKALIRALKTGHVGGVALDVYEEEEGIFFEDLSGQVLHDDQLSRLLTFPNVLITSHQAFLTQEGLSEIARVTVENILKLESGMPFAQGTTL